MQVVSQPQAAMNQTVRSKVDSEASFIITESINDSLYSYSKSGLNTISRRDYKPKDTPASHVGGTHLTPLQMRLINEMESGKHGLYPIPSVRAGKGITKFEQFEDEESDPIELKPRAVTSLT